MAVGNLISTASVTATPFGAGFAHMVFTFSDGGKIAFFRQGSGSFYALRSAGGVWSTPVALPGDYINSAFDLKQVGDTITMWSITVPSTVIRHTVFPYSAGTMGTVTSGTYTATQTYNPAWIRAHWDSVHNYWYVATLENNSRASDLYIHSFDASYAFGQTKNVSTGTDGTAGLHFGALSSASSVIYLHVIAGGSVWPITPGASGAITVGAGESGPAAEVMLFDASGNPNFVYKNTGTSPYGLYYVARLGANSYSSAYQIYTTNTPNDYLAGTMNASNGDLWIFAQTTINRGNGEIAVIRRVGGTWQTGQIIAGGDSTGYGAVASSRLVDSTVYADFLYVNGLGTGPNPYAIYWYDSPSSAAPNTPTMLSPIGTTAATGTTPAPTLAATYSNPAGSGDPLYSIEWRVINPSGPTTLWDSGELIGGALTVTYGAANNTGDPNYIAPATLPYGTSLQAQCRQKDTGAHSWSGWSAVAAFTLQQAPDGAIMALASPTGTTFGHGSEYGTLNAATSAGATSLTLHTGQGANFNTGYVISVGASPNIDKVTVSARAGDVLTVSAMTHAHSINDPVVGAVNTQTITEPSMDITVEVQQPQGHSINAYKTMVYDSLGGTVLDTDGSYVSISSVAPGGTFTINNFQLFNSPNNSTIQLGVFLKDATTGLTSEIPRWTLPTAFPAPDPVTNFSHRVNVMEGYVDLMWTEPSGMAGLEVLSRDSDPIDPDKNDWVLLPNLSTPRPGRRIYGHILRARDYMVRTVDQYNVRSTPAILNRVTIGMRYSAGGIWINDPLDPENKVCLPSMGPDLASLSSWDDVQVRDEMFPWGSAGAIVSYRATQTQRATGRRIWLPGLENGDSGDSADVVLARFRTMAALKRVVQWRDVDGQVLFVNLYSGHREAGESGSRLIGFDLLDLAAEDSPPVLVT